MSDAAGAVDGVLRSAAARAVNGTSLTGGEVFECRHGRTVLVLPVSSVTADEVEVLDG
jgi:hypothetical protein